MNTTSIPFKYGDVDDRGYVYTGQSNRNKTPHWISPRAYKRSRISSTLSAARQRAKQKNLPFDIDTTYLVSIYPTDDRCPVFGTVMTFGFTPTKRSGGNPDSPSLDRIVPSLGYVRGNVVWMSFRANAIKQNATLEEIQAVAKFLSNLKN